ncbi:helix-turn-helix domain-containing protein [Crossiella sp. NPDC003009]
MGTGNRTSELAAALRELHTLSGLTRAQLARGIGSNVRRIEDWLRGDHVPSHEALSKLLAVLIPAAAHRDLSERGPLRRPELLDSSTTGP